MEWYMSGFLGESQDRLNFLKKLNKANVLPENIKMDKVGYIYYRHTEEVF